jgi:hypothetical protein
MKININHPTFISFLEKISNNIITSVNVTDYFTLPSDQKLTISYTVFSLIRNVAKLKTNLNESELKAFITILWKKNEENENYELAEVLNDVISNFDKINEVSSKTIKKPPVKRTKKPDIENDGTI